MGKRTRLIISYRLRNCNACGRLIKIGDQYEPMFSSGKGFCIDCSRKPILIYPIRLGKQFSKTIHDNVFEKNDGCLCRHCAQGLLFVDNEIRCSLKIDRILRYDRCIRFERGHPVLIPVPLTSKWQKHLIALRGEIS